MKRRRIEDSDEDASDSESSNEEMSLDNDIEMIAKELSNNIPRGRALNLLHSMAASKAILYWNPHGEMTYHEQRIPVTSIKELIEYAMLPYNPDIRPPRGLKTFTKGLVELGINKHLIGNQKLLVDLVATQPEDEDSDESEHESDVESRSTDDQSHDHEMDEEQEEEQSSDDEDSEVGSMDEESSYDEEQRECFVCREPGQFLNISVMRCPTCHWHEGQVMNSLNQAVQCDICASVFPCNLKNTRKKLYCCNHCSSIHQVSLKSGRFKLVVPQLENQEMIEEKNHGTELDYFPLLPHWEGYY